MNDSESKILDVSERPKAEEAPKKKGGGAGASTKGGGKATRRKRKTTEHGTEEIEEEVVMEMEETTTQMAIEHLLGPTAVQGASGSLSTIPESSETAETGSGRLENAEESTGLGSSLARSSQLMGAKLKDGSALMSEKSRENDERMMTRDDSFSMAETEEHDPLLPAPVRRMRGSEIISPTVNGMRQFGLTKGVISRAIVKFTSPPEPRPCTLCFHFPSTFLTHRYVLDMVRSVIGSIPGSSVKAIQFIDRNTLHGAQGMDNRWLVTLNSVEAKNLLVTEGLTLFHRKITLKNYDDILRDEYLEYLEYADMQRKLYAKMKEELNDINETDDVTKTKADGMSDDVANKGDNVMYADHVGNWAEAN